MATANIQFNNQQAFTYDGEEYMESWTWSVNSTVRGQGTSTNTGANNIYATNSQFTCNDTQSCDITVYSETNYGESVASEPGTGSLPSGITQVNAGNTLYVYSSGAGFSSNVILYALSYEAGAAAGFMTANTNYWG